MRLKGLWKPLLTQSLVSEAHRNGFASLNLKDIFLYNFVPQPSLATIFTSPSPIDLQNLPRNVTRMLRRQKRHCLRDIFWVSHSGKRDLTSHFFFELIGKNFCHLRFNEARCNRINP